MSILLYKSVASRNAFLMTFSVSSISQIKHGHMSMFAKGCVTHTKKNCLKQMDAKHAKMVFVFDRKDSVNGAGSVNSFEW